LTASRPRPRFDPGINYYQVLDVPPAATREEITRAYRQLMRLTHPDNFQEPRLRAKAEERTKLINAAYAVLSRPEVRQEYDAQLRTSAMSDALMQRYTGNMPGRGAPPPPRRTPPPQTVREQRRAFSTAVRQIMLTTTAFVLILMAIAVVLMLAWSGLLAVIG
jgi:curved DNA-binding protein CbpA